MESHCLDNAGHPLGKGEVVSSILTGSTSISAIFGRIGRPAIPANRRNGTRTDAGAWHARGTGVRGAFLGLALTLFLFGCAAPTAVEWLPPPGAPPQALAMDSAACALVAEGMNPPDRHWHGAVIALASALETRADRLRDFGLCMRAHGYTPVAAADVNSTATLAGGGR